MPHAVHTAYVMVLCFAYLLVSLVLTCDVMLDLCLQGNFAGTSACLEMTHMPATFRVFLPQPALLQLDVIP